MCNYLAVYLCLCMTFLFITSCQRPSAIRSAEFQSQLQLARSSIINKQWLVAQQHLDLAAIDLDSYKSNPIYLTYQSQVSLGLHHFSLALSQAREAWRQSPGSFIACNNYASLLCLSFDRVSLSSLSKDQQEKLLLDLHQAHSLLKNLLANPSISQVWRSNLSFNLSRCHALG